MIWERRGRSSGLPGYHGWLDKFSRITKFAVSKQVYRRFILGRRILFDLGKFCFRSNSYKTTYRIEPFAFVLVREVRMIQSRFVQNLIVDCTSLAVMPLPVNKSSAPLKGRWVRDNRVARLEPYIPDEFRIRQRLRILLPNGDLTREQKTLDAVKTDCE